MGGPRAPLDMGDESRCLRSKNKRAASLNFFRMTKGPYRLTMGVESRWLTSRSKRACRGYRPPCGHAVSLTLWKAAYLERFSPSLVFPMCKLIALVGVSRSGAGPSENSEVWEEVRR